MSELWKSYLNFNGLTEREFKEFERVREWKQRFQLIANILYFLRYPSIACIGWGVPGMFFPEVRFWAIISIFVGLSLFGTFTFLNNKLEKVEVKTSIPSREEYNGLRAKFCSIFSIEESFIDRIPVNNLRSIASTELKMLAMGVRDAQRHSDVSLALTRKAYFREAHNTCYNLGLAKADWGNYFQ